MTVISKLPRKPKQHLKELKEMISQLSNPNLLINPDFKINQRGQSEYTSAASYTVDRWYARSNVSVIDNGVRCTYKQTSSNTSWIRQIIENPLTGIYTVSAKVRKSRADLQCRLMCADADAKNVQLANMTDWQIVKGTTPEDAKISVIAFITDIGLVTDDWIEIEWVKLEQGKIATPFVVPDHAVELVKCQRYYERMPFNYATHKRLINIMDREERIFTLNGNILFKVPKRVVPTVVMGYDINDGEELTATPERANELGFADNIIKVPIGGFIDIRWWEADAEIYL